MIDSKDISVVVQGAIDKENTPKCLKSIRKYLPNAEIILSTWEGSDISGLDYDILVENKDPGAANYVRSDGAITPNNVNRQLVSTQNGLMRCKNKFAMKLRSDLILTSNKFLNYFYKFPKRTEEYQLFKERLVIPSVYTKKYSVFTKFPVLFHPSDWWFFGLREDLYTYFIDTPLAQEPEFSNGPCKYPKKIPNPKCKNKFFAEQYYCIEAIKRKFSNIEFEDWSCWNEENTTQSQLFMINNFIVLDFVEHGIYSKKHIGVLRKNNGLSIMKGLVSHRNFLKDYKKYCDNNFSISFRYRKFWQTIEAKLLKRFKRKNII
ncbi:MAG: WavE lipopolysaccharide synthesis family protein [Campylobacteraceae bacterium]|jgi:hypothetical protein|nr:WavE lipopolysaccharide synthesis family protein [Campylobacteraceae bacterium]